MFKKLTLLLAVAASASLAASWDGTKGNVTVLTYSYSTDIPGLPTAEPVRTYTMILVKSSDASATALRVTIRYTDGVAASTRSIVVDRPTNGLMRIAPFEVSPRQITSVLVEELKTTASQEFN
jgi:hypothetical protein